MVSTNKVVVLLPLTGTQKLVTCVFGTGPKDWNQWMWSKRNRSQSSILAASKIWTRRKGWGEMIQTLGDFVSWIFSDFGVDVADPSAAKSSGDGPWQPFLFKAGLSISSGAKASWLKGLSGSLKIPPLWNCFKWEEKTLEHLSLADGFEDFFISSSRFLGKCCNSIWVIVFQIGLKPPTSN